MCWVSSALANILMFTLSLHISKDRKDHTWFYRAQAWTHKVVRSSRLKEGGLKALGTSKGSKGKRRKLSGILSVPSHQTHPILSASLPFHPSLFPPWPIQSHLSSTIPSLPSTFPSHLMPFHFPSCLILSHHIPLSPFPPRPSIPSLLSQIPLSYSLSLSYPFPPIPSHPRSFGTCLNPDWMASTEWWEHDFHHLTDGILGMRGFSSVFSSRRKESSWEIQFRQMRI